MVVSGPLEMFEQGHRILLVTGKGSIDVMEQLQVSCPIH